MFIESTEVVLLAATVPLNGIARKIAATVANVGLVVDQALCFFGTAEIVVGIVSAVRLHKLVEVGRVKCGTMPCLEEQRFSTECRHAAASYEDEHPREEGESHL